MHVTLSMFAQLPLDILLHELRPKLDDISLLCLRVALHTDVLPNRIPLTLKKQVFRYDIHFAKYFIDNNVIKSGIVCELAATSNNITVLQWAITQKYPCDASVPMAACAEGSLAALTYLIESRRPPTTIHWVKSLLKQGSSSV